LSDDDLIDIVPQETDAALASALIEGEQVALPDDLYVPPDALHIFLDTFEGPLDLLLYLIQKQNLDIINIPIAEITQQYIRYIELMQDLQLDLAAEYLVMASMLMSIKSRMLLPVNEEEGEAVDPRARLIQQLQEYARYKKAAQNLNALPQVGRDVFLAQTDIGELPKEIRIPAIPFNALLAAMQDVMSRVDMFSAHQISREPLSVRERMSLVLAELKTQEIFSFTHFFTLEEGRAGAVVTFLALLELAKTGMIYFTQSELFGEISVQNLSTTAEHSV